MYILRGQNNQFILSATITLTDIFNKADYSLLIV